jgi:hypothetical protein
MRNEPSAVHATICTTESKMPERLVKIKKIKK